MEKRALFAYCANLDSVVKIKVRDAMQLSKYLPGLIMCMKSGEGRELRVSEAVFRKTTGLLLGRESERIGGQAGNMALDASKLGVKSYLHTPNKSRELLSLFNDNVLVATENGFVPARKASDDSKPPVHLILEFGKGRGIPSSNRFIASSENLNPSLYIDSVFSRKIKEEMPKISRGFLAGFHLLSPSVFRKKKQLVLGQISSWKRLNPKLKLHLEWGCFVSKETEALVAKHILPLVDSVAFNEDEMPSLLKTVGGKGKLGEIYLVLKRTKTAVLHTRDYSIAFSKEFSSRSLAKSLSFASCVAGFKASRGRAPSFAELKKTKFRMKKIEPPKLNEGKFRESGISIAFCPSVEIKPKFTVGLGDCFSMAFFLTLK
ncbi:MAG: ADP-dependent glucokinase/phosphofructokinase [Candidatus Micrarchaeota archaeon]